MVTWFTNWIGYTTVTTWVQLVFFFFYGFQQVTRRPGIYIVGQLTESAESLFLIHPGSYHDFFLSLMIHLLVGDSSRGPNN